MIYQHGVPVEVEDLDLGENFYIIPDELEGEGTEWYNWPLYWENVGYVDEI